MTGFTTRTPRQPSSTLGDSPHSALTRRLVEDGLKPATVSAQAVELHRQFHAVAMHVLTKGAPGLSETTCNALAISIALRCERVIQTQERAA